MARTNRLFDSQGSQLFPGFTVYLLVLGSPLFYDDSDQSGDVHLASFTTPALRCRRFYKNKLPQYLPKQSTPHTREQQNGKF